MFEYLIYIGLVIGLLILSLIIQRVEWGKLKVAAKEQGIIPGIVISFALLSLLTLALIFFSNKANAVEVSYFNYAEIDVGLLYTKKVSPQCKPESSYSKTTSDLRVTGNIMSFHTDNKNVLIDLNMDYLHHSCELGEDRNSFDGVGPKARIRFNF